MFCNKKNISFFLFLSSLIGIGLWIFFKPTSYPIEECKTLFASSIYSNYRIQLQSFVRQHVLYEEVRSSPPTAFNLSVKNLLEEINRTTETESAHRLSHEMFVTQLRKLTLDIEGRKEQEEKASLNLFRDIIGWMFLQADLKPSLSEFLFQHLPPPKENLFTYLPMAQSALRGNPHFNGIKHESLMEDQLLQGNLPYVIATLGKSPTKLIRIGQPFDRPSRLFFWQKPLVYPEFFLFLNLQHSHFYVNLMKRKGMEGPFSQSIEALEKQISQLYVVTLDKNSSFYWQSSNEYPESWESQSFKKFFINQMLDRKGNYYWSLHLPLGLWEKELEEILHVVHQHFFGGKDNLDRQERQDFIELTYLSILDSLVQKWQPASMNVTCKQGMDRGPSLAMLWMFQKKQLDEKVIASQLLAPPLIIHNRASHASRIERFVSAAKRIEKCID
jgi:hypothetical protein